MFFPNLKELGVRVWTRQGQVKNDTAIDDLLNSVTFYVAAQENQVRRDKMLAFRKREREAGEPFGVAPYGLRHSDDGKSYAADPERSQIIKEAFRLRLAGEGYLKIGRKLAAVAPSKDF